MIRRTTFALGVAIVAVGPCWAIAADDTWYQPLDTKARILEQQVLKWHWIDGLYPSQVEVPPDGGTPDHSTNGVSNVMHTVCWTANHLAGESYRYAFIKKTGTPEQIKAVRDHVNAIFEGVHRCQKVTGIRGFQARGYLYGHGPTYEERVNDRFADYWYQGAGEYKDLRWRGAPSHHNYSAAIRGMGAYYRLAAEGKHKDQCRQAIDDLVSIWADNDLKIPTKDARPGQHGGTMLLLTDGKTPTMPVIMVAGGLKVAHYATGKAKFAKLYEKITTQFGFRKRTKFRRFSRLDTDDAEHVFCHLDNLLNMEKDAELRRFYRVVLEALWESHKDSKCPLFNYIYLGLTPDAKDKARCLSDALWTLQSHPTNMHFQPRMNSLRDDIQKEGGFSKKPMAVFECAWDNEYMWKGHLYQLNGWLSRIVIALDVARDDPMVIYAVDESEDVYRSGDGATTWQWIGKSPGGRPIKLVCGHKRRIVFAVTPTAAYRSIKGGAEWNKLATPANGGTITDLQLDETNPNRLYLVTDRGVYRSLDFGEKWIGDRWECLTPIVPPAESVRLTLGQGKPGMVYGQFDNELRSMLLDGSGKWSGPTRLGYRGYLRTYPWVLVDPDKPEHVTCAYRLDFRNLDEEFLKGVRLVGSILSRSTDGGLTWTYSQDAVMKRLREQGTYRVILKALADLVPQFLDTVAADPQDPNVIYAASGTVFLVNRNQGRTWTKIMDGLDIPKVETLFAPRAGRHVYAGTPAGLYRLERGAKKWRYANLRLQFTRNLQRDLGGAAYLDAYWRGRYFGFINDEQATENPTTWQIPEKYKRWVPRR
jgi:hypothetical protein